MSQTLHGDHGDAAGADRVVGGSGDDGQSLMLIDVASGDPMDSLDDGGSAVGRSGSDSGALPFVVSAREEFAALGDLPVTGDPRVDAATARLEEVAELPTSDHVGVYDDVHRRLQDTLADADVR